MPVVKIFNPTGAATWIISEQSPEHPDQLFGLCDLGFGSPEIGYVSLAELQSVRGSFGLPLERDILFKGEWPLDVYLEAARYNEGITERHNDLMDALIRLVARDWDRPELVQAHQRNSYVTQEDDPLVQKKLNSGEFWDERSAAQDHVSDAA